MSNEALTALLASKIPSVAHRAAAVLNKRKCKVATEGKRTGLPKLKTLAEEFGFTLKVSKSSVKKTAINCHNQMKTAYLIYRPVMDHEESEESYLICSTKERAEEVRFEMITFCRQLLESLESLYDDSGDMLPDEQYLAAEKRNYAKMENAKWPYSVSMSFDIPWRQYNTSFDAGCISIRELPLV